MLGSGLGLGDFNAAKEHRLWSQIKSPSLKAKRLDASGIMKNDISQYATDCTERLKNWCADINKSQKKYRFDFIFVDEEDFERYKPDNFEKLVRNFIRYKG